MSETSETEKQTSIGYGDPYYLTLGDHATLQLVSIPFKGENYLN